MMDLQFTVTVPLDKLYRRVPGHDDYAHFDRLTKLVCADDVFNGRYGQPIIAVSMVDGAGNKLFTHKITEQVPPNIQVRIDSDDVI